MPEYQPVRTKAELDQLDADDILDGYRNGLDNPDQPGSDKSKSFWHGWRNAQVDRHRVQADDAQAQLAREYVGRYVGLH